MRLAILSLLLLPFFAVPLRAEDKKPLKFEDEAARLEAAEKERPSPKGGVVFSGSSSIRLWKLADSFPNWPVVNRGLGGSTVAENIPFIDRLIVPHAPKVIVFYAGDNDMAANHTPDQVAEDFKKYVSAVRERLPKVKILFLSIKPSIARWKLWPQMQEANARVQAWCRKTEGLGFMDIAPVTLGSDGKPNPALFQKDGLHLNPDGYAAWTKVVRDQLTKEVPELASAGGKQNQS